MSYDLLFWRQTEEERRPAAVIANELRDDRVVAGIAALPIDEILSRIREAFPELTSDGGLTYWEGESAGMFELYFSRQHIHFCCRQLLAEHCNTLIDVMRDFDCPLYDPQVDQRFDRDGTHA